MKDIISNDQFRVTGRTSGHIATQFRLMRERQYVLATKYSDKHIGDRWAVGFIYSVHRNGGVQVCDEHGALLDDVGMLWFNCVTPISKEEGDDIIQLTQQINSTNMTPIEKTLNEMPEYKAQFLRPYAELAKAMIKAGIKINPESKLVKG